MGWVRQVPGNHQGRASIYQVNADLGLATILYPGPLAKVPRPAPALLGPAAPESCLRKAAAQVGAGRPPPKVPQIVHKPWPTAVC